MKIEDKPKIQLPLDMDEECIEICDTLNIDSIPEEPVSDEEIEALNDVRHLNPGLDSLYLKLLNQ